MIYVLDEVAASRLLKARHEVDRKDFEIIDMRGMPYEPVHNLSFVRIPKQGGLDDSRPIALGTGGLRAACSFEIRF